MYKEHIGRKKLHGLNKKLTKSEVANFTFT